MCRVGFEPTSLLRETGLQPVEPPTAQPAPLQSPFFFNSSLLCLCFFISFLFWSSTTIRTLLSRSDKKTITSKTPIFTLLWFSCCSSVCIPNFSLFFSHNILPMLGVEPRYSFEYGILSPAPLPIWTHRLRKI